LITATRHDQAHREWRWRTAQESNSANDDVYFIDWGKGTGVHKAQGSVCHPGSIAGGCGRESLRLGDVEKHLHRIGASRGDLDQAIAQARRSDKDPIGEGD